MNSIRVFALVILAIQLMVVPNMVQSARILSVFPAVSKSHYAVGEALSVGLAEAGHNVTIIGPYEYKSRVANLEVIHLSGAEEVAAEQMKDSKSVDQFNIPVGLVLPIIIWSGEVLSNYTLMHPNVRRLMETRSFDLVIFESFSTDALIGLGQHFGAPVIAVSTFGASKWVNDLVGNPSPLSYVPHAFSTFSSDMTLWQRVINTVIQSYDVAINNLIGTPFQRRVYERAFPDAKVSYDQAVNNVSLILLNSHFSINNPRPYVPNMIEVGGMHVKRTTNPLPPNIQTFLDSATDGAIFFSLGSLLKSAYLSAERKSAIVNVFGSLRQKVIWKFEEELDVPDNVMISSWLPQNDIIAHPNVKLFISHGGLLGTTEAVFHAVPVLGMPFFGDQKRNIEGYVSAGWALRLDYANVTEESLRWALDEMLNNQKYADNARLVSQRYRDQPLTPLETAVYWSEYVIRHRGAPHLRSASMNLNFIQYHNLDALLILAVASAVWTLVSVAVLLWCCRKCFGRKTQTDNSKKRE